MGRLAFPKIDNCVELKRKRLIDGTREAALNDFERPNRRGLREQERARRAEQQRQRDEALGALEAAARRRGTADRDDDEDEDPWAAPGRRRGN